MVLPENGFYIGHGGYKYDLLVYRVDCGKGDGEMKRIDEATFDSIKKPLYNRFARPRVIAKRFGISEKTARQIKGSTSWADYHLQTLAQHPQTLYSLRDEVLHLHKLSFCIDNTYIPPKTARTAIKELQNKEVE